MLSLALRRFLLDSDPKPSVVPLQLYADVRIPRTIFWSSTPRRKRATAQDDHGSRSWVTPHWRPLPISMQARQSRLKADSVCLQWRHLETLDKPLERLENLGNRWISRDVIGRQPQADSR